MPARPPRTAKAAVREIGTYVSLIGWGMMRSVPDPSLKARLASGFSWRGDASSDHERADLTGWWRDPSLLRDLASGLAELSRQGDPTVVLAIPSRGVLLGSLVADRLGVGLVEARKDPSPAVHSDAWLTATTPPDYRDRHLELGFRRGLIKSADRVAIVDDWIDTGGQATAATQLVEAAGATFIATVVVVDALREPTLRRTLRLRSLLRDRELV